VTGAFDHIDVPRAKGDTTLAIAQEQLAHVYEALSSSRPSTFAHHEPEGQKLQGHQNERVREPELPRLAPVNPRGPELGSPREVSNGPVPQLEGARPEFAPFIRDAATVLPVEVEIVGDALHSFPDKTEAWRKVKELVNREGRDPTNAVTDAISKSKMVGIGELHTVGERNPNRDWAIAHMKDFAKAGTRSIRGNPQCLETGI